ncbi:MAG TPA: glycosyltransferase family 39 protein [Bryobacteraceae bacterium]|nr:glycosyltransferase family 39 protein [Bryobacteraceae bacterium]
MNASLKRLASAAWFIFAAALALRFAILWFTWRHAALDAASAPYGYELGCVAKSIASGKGFSSPLPFFATGPTAWLSPIFPYIVAGIFKLWGIYTVKSHIAIQTLNCLFSALTIFPIYAIARRSFGAAVAIGASWVWVILPAAWHIPIWDVWDTSLSALLFALLFWTTLALRSGASPAKWAGYGALWAVAALVNTSLVSVLPFFLLWLAWEAYNQRQPWLRPVAVALLVFVLGLAPWTIRNHRVFGKFVPVRSVLGITLWMGNNPTAVGIDSFPLLPTLNLAAAEKFRQMGEIDYAHAKGREAVAFMLSHPALTAHHMLRSFASFWLTVSDRPDETWSTDPASIKALLVLNGLLILLAAIGIAAAWRLRNPAIVPYACVLLVFPLVYYVTYPLVRFRFAIEPLLAILAIYGAKFILAPRDPLKPS